MSRDTETRIKDLKTTIGGYGDALWVLRKQGDSQERVAYYEDLREQAIKELRQLEDQWDRTKLNTE